MKPKVKRGAPRKTDGQNRRDKTEKEVKTKKGETIVPQPPSAKADPSHKLHTPDNNNSNVVLPIESTNTPVVTPWHQKALERITWAVIGIFLLGSGLDAISNAIALITPIVTYVGTGLVVLAAFATGIYLKHFPLSWVVEGRKIKKSRLESKQYVQIAGMILLLWVPRFFDLFRNPEPHQNNVAKVSTEQTEQPQMKPTPANDANNANVSVAANQTQTVDVQPTTEAKKIPHTIERSESLQINERVKSANKTLKNGQAPLSKTQAAAPNSLAIAENLFKRGKYDEAIAACNAVLRRDPKNKNAASLKQRIQKTKQILEQ